MGAAFCMHCGQMLGAVQPVTAPAPTQMAQGVPFAPPRGGSRRGVAWAIAAAILLILAGGFWGLHASGALKLVLGRSGASMLPAGGSSDRADALGIEGSGLLPDTLTSEGESQLPDTLRAEGQGGPPTSSQMDELTVMPEDVRRWLEHLERIERRRVRMTEAHMAVAMQMIVAAQLGGMSMADIEAMLGGEERLVPEEALSPLNKAASDMDSMRKEWTELTNDFNSLAPPQECVPIRSSYDQVVRETGAMIMDVIRAVGSADQDRTAALQTLLSMRGKSGSRIGVPADKADSGVARICDKYKTRKWFSIARDIGGGMMNRMGF